MEETIANEVFTSPSSNYWCYVSEKLSPDGVWHLSCRQCHLILLYRFRTKSATSNIFGNIFQRIDQYESVL